MTARPSIGGLFHESEIRSRGHQRPTDRVITAREVVPVRRSGYVRRHFRGLRREGVFRDAIGSFDRGFLIKVSLFCYKPFYRRTGGATPG